KGDNWSNWSLTSDKCKKNNQIGLAIKFSEGTVSDQYSTTVPGVNTQVIGGTGDCVAAIGNLLPYTNTVPSNAKEGIYCLMVYYGQKNPVDGFCMLSGSGFDEIIEDVSCAVASGDIIHDYGTLSLDEVDGKSITTNMNIACHSGASVGKVSVRLSIENNPISLKEDGSLFADVNINGNAKPLTFDIGVNGSINLNVSSVLHGNGAIPSGAFSGNSLLTMTYN
ncbi:TPA: hypothetical protein MB295_005296, partial [Klebsiella pneumoniae]|nr:hypothetical protein [Klebsiella pneumoniae]